MSRAIIAVIAALVTFTSAAHAEAPWPEENGSVPISTWSGCVSIGLSQAYVNPAVELGAAGRVVTLRNAGLDSVVACFEPSPDLPPAFAPYFTRAAVVYRVVDRPLDMVDPALQQLMNTVIGRDVQLETARVRALSQRSAQVGACVATLFADLMAGGAMNTARATVGEAGAACASALGFTVRVGDDPRPVLQALSTQAQSDMADLQAMMGRLDRAYDLAASAVLKMQLSIDTVLSNIR